MSGEILGLTAMWPQVFARIDVAPVAYTCGVVLTSLHLLLTYRCTSACDHCFVHGSPRAEGTFTLARLESALDQAVELGTVRSVYFEGGEPFLFHPLLVEGTRLARERGLEVGIVTNAYWATGLEEARRWLEPLAELGVSVLSVSEDEYHGSPAEDGPAARALAAAEALGIPAGTIAIEQAGAAGGSDRGAPVDGGGPMMKGRAADRLVSGLRRHPADGFTDCPHEELRRPDRVHLDPFGHLHLCQGVLMGTLWPATLREVVERWDPEGHPVVGPLLAGGPSELARRRGIAPDPSGYVDACHLCYTVRRACRAVLPLHLGPPQVYGV